MVTPAALRRAGEALYGPLWIGPLAIALKVNRRTVAGWAAGQRNGRPVEIPEGIGKEISALARKRVAALKSL